MPERVEDYCQDYGGIFEGGDFLKPFAKREYRTPKTADCVRIRLAVSWSERCDEGEKVFVRIENIFQIQ